MCTARIVARDSCSASRVGTALGFVVELELKLSLDVELGFALGLSLASALGSWAQATGVAASRALTVPQRSSRAMDPIAFQPSGATAKLVCTATQLRRSADELRERHGTAVGIDDAPLVRMLDEQAGRRALELAGCEPKSRARRPGNWLLSHQVLLA